MEKRGHSQIDVAGGTEVTQVGCDCELLLIETGS
jgi:hypothetical protein